MLLNGATVVTKRRCIHRPALLARLHSLHSIPPPWLRIALCSRRHRTIQPSPTQIYVICAAPPSQTCQHRPCLVRQLLSADGLGSFRICGLLGWCVCLGQLIGVERQVGSRGIDRSEGIICLQSKKLFQIGYLVLRSPIPSVPDVTFRTREARAPWVAK